VTWLRHARPHLIKAAVAAAVAISGLVGASFGEELERGLGLPDRVPEAAGAIIVLVAGVVAVRATARAVRMASGEQLGDARGTGLALVVTVIGYLLVLTSAISAFGVNPAGLLLGGAITGIVIGIAAQQTLSNFFAGIVLLVNRPLAVGEHAVMRSGTLGGEYEGLVTDMSLFYVTMETATGRVVLPNAGVLASSIGPGARAPKEKEETEEAEEQAAPQSGGQPTGDPSGRVSG
jgi:small-conductance mechanosensitive channel